MEAVEGAQLPASGVGPQYQKLHTDFIYVCGFVQRYEECDIREGGMK